MDADAGAHYRVARLRLTELLTDQHDEVLTTKDAGGPAHHVATTAFEITRIRLGRRAPEQVLAMPWEPSLPAVPDGLFVFGPRATPLEERSAGGD